MDGSMLPSTMAMTRFIRKAYTKDKRPAWKPLTFKECLKIFARIDRFQKNIIIRIRFGGLERIVNVKATIELIIRLVPIIAVRVCSKRSLYPKKSSSPPVRIVSDSTSITAAPKSFKKALIKNAKTVVPDSRNVDAGRFWGPSLSKHIRQRVFNMGLIVSKPFLSFQSRHFRNVFLHIP